VGGLVALAAEALRSEEGGIGFDEDGVERKDGSDVAQGLGFRIGDVAGEGDAETHVEAAAGIVESAAETVENAAVAGAGPAFFEDGQAIGPGLAAVDDDGQAAAAGDGELVAKDGLLNVARGVVVVIVEADFTPGDDANVSGVGFGFLEMALGDEFGFVGMDTDGGVDPGVLLGERDGRVEMVGAGSTADGEDGGDAGFAGAGEDGIAVRLEVGEIEMGVGVDQFHDGAGAGRRRYLSREPTGASSWKPASTGRPSGPTVAATTMPFDSTPRSLRGARLTTTMTRRPMSFSGS